MNYLYSNIIRSGVVLGLILSVMAFNAPDTKAQEILRVFDQEGNLIREIDKEMARIQEEEVPSLRTKDSLALVSLYHATGGDNWINNGGWLEDPAALWHGVHSVDEYEGEWYVSRLSLRGNRLTGNIPEDFSDMERMWRMDLDRNHMSGAFPMTLTEMELLRFIEIGEQYYSGTVPWEAVGNMPNLVQFKIRHNFFEGEIPDFEEGTWPRLALWQVPANLFTGPFPGGWDNLENISRVIAWDNRFTGSMNVLEPIKYVEDFEILRIHFNYNLDPEPIPEWLQEENLPEDIWEIDIRGTNRTGEVPTWFNNMWALERLGLGGGDELGGELPYMGDALSLERLMITDANFTGSIPDWIGLRIERLLITNTPFTGQIPDLLNVEQLTLEGLQLDGPLPNWGGLPLEVLQLENLGFEIDEIPSWIGDLSGLEQLTLNNMGISGEIPDFLGSLNNLRRIRLADNPGITGDVPSWLRNMDDLTHLELSRTGLNIPEIPMWLTNHPEIRHIELGGLGMTGEIPGWLGDFEFLSRLVLDGNELEGEIPWQFGNLAFMDSLNVANNLLEGEVPVQLAEMGYFEDATNLTALVLSGNENLTGPVPVEFTNWDPILFRVFHFEDTGLCEPDDSEFQNWLTEVATPWNPADPLTKVSVKSTGVICGEEPPTSAETDSPVTFHLHQNYPNPFNPTTNIRFDVPSESHVQLNVYNVLGQRVATLVNEQMSEGRYEVNFDATRLSSGTYIYRLEAGNRSMTQTMMLIK